MARFEKARSEDAKSLALISGEAFDNDIHYGAPGKGGPPGYKSDVWQIRMMARGHYYKIILAEDNERIIGGLIVFQNSFGDCELGRIFIAPEYQNQGIGTQAMAFMESAFPDARRWTLGTPNRTCERSIFTRRQDMRASELRGATGCVTRNGLLPPGRSKHPALDTK